MKNLKTWCCAAGAAVIVVLIVLEAFLVSRQGPPSSGKEVTAGPNPSRTAPAPDASLVAKTSVAPPREQQPGQMTEVVASSPEPGSLSPACLPGQIVIPTADEDGTPSTPTSLYRLPPVHDLVGVMPPAGPGQDSEADEAVMPGVEETSVPMPYAEESSRPDGASQRQQQEILPLPLEKNSQPVSTPVESRKMAPAVSGGCEIGGMEECEPLETRPASSRVFQDGQGRLGHSQVDTMEFRPSDAGITSDLRGPF